MGFQMGGTLETVDALRSQYMNGEPVHGHYLLIALHACVGLKTFLALGMAFLYQWHIFDHIYIEPGWALATIVVQAVLSLALIACAFGMSPVWAKRGHWIYGVHYTHAAQRHASDAYNWNLFTAGLACAIVFIGLHVPFIWIWARYTSDIIGNRANWELALTSAADGLATFTNGAAYYKFYFIANSILSVAVAGILARTGHTWFNYGVHADGYKNKGF